MKHRRSVLVVVIGMGLLAGAMTLIAAGGPPSLAQGDIIYVDAEAPGLGDGEDWTTAYTDLQDALATASSGDQIWVAEGVYTPTWQVDSDPRTATFQMVNGVAIYGGFDPSAGDTEWEERDWEANPTVLSGDIGAEGEPADNSYHVFYHAGGLGSSAILDGFTITDGNADGDVSPYRDGGGMYNDSSSPTLANLTFTGNSAGLYGGGIHNANYSAPSLSNCAFVGNSAAYGGGMTNYLYAAPVVTNCTFADNTASQGGGGLFNGFLADPVLTNCTFWHNTATFGGGIYNHYSSPVLTNCTITGNTALISGAGIYNSSESAPVLTNCILWGDTAGGLPSEIDGDGSSVPVITYSDIKGGWEGDGNIDANPLFVDPDNGDFHLLLGSPCIDAGNNSAPDLPSYDFEGDPRIVDGDGNGSAIVDMGVDELAAPGTCLQIYLPLVIRAY